MKRGRGCLAALGALLVARLAAADVSAAPLLLQVQAGSVSRITADQVKGGLTVTLALNEDIAIGNVAIAQFQNDLPLMLASGGQWLPWNGDPAALADSGAAFDGSSLTYSVLSAGATMFWPAAITFGYQTNYGLRSATVIIDESAP